MNNSAVGALAFFISVASSAAFCQTQSNDVNPHVDTVTVTAPKAANAKPTPFLTGGSRWLFAICPVTIGLMPEEDRQVTTRVQQVAALVGAPFRNGNDCHPNAEIVFTRAPQEFLDAVAAKDHRLLGNIDVSEATEASRVHYPIQSWYSTAMMDDRGYLLLQPPDGDECIPYCFFYKPMTPPPIHPFVIDTVIIVIDINEVQGHKLESLSDYVALMALSQARAFTKCQALPSIVNLMAENCSDEMRTDGLTPSDIAWLRGLYHMSPEAAKLADQKDLVAQSVSVNGRRGE